MGARLFVADGLTPPQSQAQTTQGDPCGSFQWPDLTREFLGAGTVVFDGRVKVLGPALAEDPMNAPITVYVTVWVTVKVKVWATLK